MDTPPPESSESSSFVYSELSNALQEQRAHGGIAGWEIMHHTPLEATARVALLEENTIHITLTAQGYTLNALHHGLEYPASAEEHIPVFESIEGLLQSVSIMYSGALQQALLQKLNALGPT